MCLLSFEWQPDAAAPLTIAANRDEFYARPTQSLHGWAATADGQIFAGQDLQGGGTWMGVHRPSGRLAALTNYRDPRAMREDAPTRGGIVTAFLNGRQGAAQFAAELAEYANTFNAFNLLLFDGRDLLAFESRHRRYFTPEPGVWAVSNADFNTPWPKLLRLRSAFADVLQAQSPEHRPNAAEISPALEAALWPLLADTGIAADAALPSTGIRLELERALSAAFICTPGYGTRASTLVRHARQRVQVVERSFDARGPSAPLGTLRFDLDGLQA